jgi:hypothetical protein
MIMEMLLKLILAILTEVSRETILNAERTLEQGITVTIRGLAQKPDIGHVAIGKLEDQFLTILKANNVV